MQRAIAKAFTCCFINIYRVYDHDLTYGSIHPPCCYHSGQILHSKICSGIVSLPKSLRSIYHTSTMKIFVTVAATLAACAQTISADVSAGPTWGYHTRDANMIDSANWASEWDSCGGVRQSPIDIAISGMCGKGEAVPLKFGGSCSTYNLAEPHEPLEVDVVGGDCTVSVKDATYNMLQFHLHAPSEHTINGKALDASIHFVHASEDGDLLVVGILLEISAKSDPWLAPLLDALETVSSASQTDALTVELESYSKLIVDASQNSSVYNYPGSLTTPSCNETVDWWVVEKAVKISSIDFGRLHQDLVEYEITDNGNNARPAQPLNGRTVTRYN
ncbi:putative alpha carbonic anhydrase domain, carbonic anhydrase, alpha-class [Plasmopara halstedii]